MTCASTVRPQELPIASLLLTVFLEHYFTAASPANCLMLVVCTASYSLFITIPQYWMKRWTESYDGSTSYYACVYLLLAVLAWTSTNGTMWYDHNRPKFQSTYLYA